MFRPRFLAIFREHIGVLMCAASWHIRQSGMRWRWRRYSTNLHGVTHYRTTTWQTAGSCWDITTIHIHCVGNCRMLVHIVTIGLEMWNSRLSIGLPFTDLRLSAMSSAGLQERRSESVCRSKGRPCREHGRPTDRTAQVTGLAAHGQYLCRSNRREQRCSATHS